MSCVHSTPLRSQPRGYELTRLPASRVQQCPTDVRHEDTHITRSTLRQDQHITLSPPLRPATTPNCRTGRQHFFWRRLWSQVQSCTSAPANPALDVTLPFGRLEVSRDSRSRGSAACFGGIKKQRAEERPDSTKSGKNDRQEVCCRPHLNLSLFCLPDRILHVPPPSWHPRRCRRRHLRYSAAPES